MFPFRQLFLDSSLRFQQNINCSCMLSSPISTWWCRKFVREYLPIVSTTEPSFVEYLKRAGILEVRKYLSCFLCCSSISMLLLWSDRDCISLHCCLVIFVPTISSNSYLVLTNSIMCCSLNVFVSWTTNVFRCELRVMLLFLPFSYTWSCAYFTCFNML